MKKYCTKCGQPFDAVGREVICPSCKAAAAEETKRAAVLRAKRASWAGESVPVRISGRASTIIREYGREHDVPFAESLDALIRTTDFFLSLDKAWVDITPYKSHRRDKATAQDVPQDKPQDKPQETAQETAQGKQVMQFGDFGVVINTSTAKAASKTSTAKAASKAKASKASASKASKASASK